MNIVDNGHKIPRESHLPFTMGDFGVSLTPKVM